MKKFQFNPEINWGHLLIAGTILFTCFGYILKSENRLTTLEIGQKSITENQLSMAQTLKQLEERTRAK